MNKENYKAFIESDEILDGFVTAILFYKADALVFGKYGIYHGTRPELKQHYYEIAEKWLKNYFDNFSDMDYEDVAKKIKKRGIVKKHIPQTKTL